MNEKRSLSNLMKWPQGRKQSVRNNNQLIFFCSPHNWVRNIQLDIAFLNILNNNNKID